jgi:hypothetical protein
MQSRKELFFKRKDSLFKPVLLSVTKPRPCGRMWEDGMYCLVLLKEPGWRLFAVSRAATRGKLLTFLVYLHACPHALPHNPRNWSVQIYPWDFCSCSTYIHAYIHKYIHTYTHTHTNIHTYMHTHIYTQSLICSVCIKGTHNGEVASISPHISLLRLHEAHR